MSQEKKPGETLLKANVEDSTQLVADLGTQDELATSTKVIENESFENLLLRMIENILFQPSIEEFEVYWNIIELLGEFLELQDYKTNLFSGWILKTLAQKMVCFSNEIHKCDYRSFINWLYEEIKLVCNNQDMTREHFFELMNKTFFKALSKILEGKGLLPFVELIYEYSGEEEMKTPSSSTIPECDDNRSSIIGDNEEIIVNTKETQVAPEITPGSKNIYYEKLLDVIIEVTYEIFGKEVDYILIQSASIEEKVSYYELPYHYRKPRTIEKIESTTKGSSTSGSKPEKKKKRKSMQKSTAEKMNMKSASSYQLPSILPLSEAIDCYDVIHSREKNEEMKIGT